MASLGETEPLEVVMGDVGSVEGLLQQVGPYRVEERLGAGGMGEVFRAFDERLGRAVALKQILPERAANSRARGRFRREARSAARLNHPNIVKVHDILARDDGDWIVMELVEGETLAKRLESGPLAMERALSLARELAAALAVAHDEGIVHRDLKANNVLITPEGHIKILDFGLAKQVLQPQESSSISIDGQLLGTPRAMSPEQAMGRKVDLRSDLFSLGSLLYEAVTGVAPFRGQGPLETLRRVCTHQQTPAHELVPTVSQGFSRVLEQLMQKDPMHRPQTAAEVVGALECLSARSEDAIETLVEDDLTVVDGALSGGGGEKRQVTVMGCELVSADESAGSLDPELLIEVVGEFEEAVHGIVRSYEGSVANFLGHRAIVHFGYPKSHEDDAERAVRAAFAIVDWAKGVQPPGTAESGGLSVRCGLHTGAAVVLGLRTEDEQLVLGPTLDRVSELQRLAEPGQVLISELARGVIRSHYSSEILRNPRIEAVSTRRVFEIFPVKDASGPWGLWTESEPMIGRDRELEFLAGRLQLAEAGQGQVALLMGEAGIGKSRLVHALRRQVVENHNVRWLDIYGSAFAQNSPLYPLTGLMEKIFEFGMDDSAGQKYKKMEEYLRQAGLDSGQLGPLLASVMNLEIESESEPSRLSPQRQMELTLLGLKSMIFHIAKHRPLVLFVEDLHWIDPSSLDLIDLLVEEINADRILILLTFRPEFENRWLHKKQVTQLHLSRLPETDVRALIHRVTQGQDLPDVVEEQIHLKTDGIPLFVEELTRNLLESDLMVQRGGCYELNREIDELQIPSSLRDSLNARLDRLGAAKEVAQIGATIGREFSYRLLTRISALPNKKLEHALEKLVEAELVIKRGFSRRRRYVFRHALIRDAAYESILGRRRKEYHTNIATILVNQFDGIVGSQPELVAHHFTEASVYPRAIEYWQKAGNQAASRSANYEAIRHVESGLRLLEYVPSRAERDTMELHLQSILGPVMIINRGFAAPEVEEVFNRAYDLCEAVGESAQLGWILKGLTQFADTRAELDRALGLAHRVIDLSQSTEDPQLEITGYFLLGVVLHHRGDILAAHHANEKTLELNWSIGDVDSYAEPRIAAETKTHLAFEYWMEGFPDKALEVVNEAVHLARQASNSSNSSTLGWALSWCTLIHSLRRDYSEVQRIGREASEVCEEVGIPIWLAQTKMLVAYSGAIGNIGGEVVEEVENIENSISAFCSSGARVWRGFMDSHLIEASITSGEGSWRRMRELAAERFESCAKSGELFWQPEILRLRGQLAMEDSSGSLSCRIRDAERYFRKAIDSAQTMGAKSLALRAAISLNELPFNKSTRSQDLEQRSIETLSEIYEGFTEGFGTGDLRRAREIISSVRRGAAQGPS